MMKEGTAGWYMLADGRDRRDYWSNLRQNSQVADTVRECCRAWPNFGLTQILEMVRIQHQDDTIPYMLVKNAMVEAGYRVSEWVSFKEATALTGWNGRFFRDMRNKGYEIKATGDGWIHQGEIESLCRLRNKYQSGQIKNLRAWCKGHSLNWYRTELTAARLGFAPVFKTTPRHIYYETANLNEIWIYMATRD
jgi:hypothetical protein